MKKVLIISLFVCMSLLSAAAFTQTDVTITGKTGKSGLLVRLIVYDDMLSEWQKTLVSTTTDALGNFFIQTPLQQPEYALLAVGPDKGEIFLLPGKTYAVEIDDLPANAFASYYDEEPLRFRIISTTDGGTGEQLTTVNLIVNTFLLQHFNDLYRRGKAGMIDSLRNTIAERIPQFAHPYLADYCQYKIASVELATPNKTNQRIIETYFLNKPIQYGNIEYTSLFVQVFSNYLLNLRGYDQNKLDEAFKKGYAAVKQLLNTDANLATDPKLAELVLLLNLKDIYFMRNFDKDAVTALLKEISQTSKYPKHKQIAANVIKADLLLAYNTPAPAISLNDASGNKVETGQFADRFVLITFVKSDCPPCLSELEDLQKMSEQYANKLQLITIASHDSFEPTVKHFRENRFTWPVLDLSDNFLLLEAYNIKAFPEHIILIPGSRIGMAPAPAIDQGLDRHLERLMKQQANKP